jgi:hypothetical protein
MNRLYFLCFEKANYPAIAPFLERLGERALFVRGFDYKEVSGQVSPWRVPALDLFSLVPESPEDARPEPALDAAFAGREYWPLILHRRRWAARALRAFFETYRPRRVVVPEDVHYIQGRLVAEVLRPLGVKIHVLVAPYYQIHLSTPLLGQPLGDRYWVNSDAMAEALVARGVPRGAVSVVSSPACPPRPDPVRRLWFAAQGVAWEDLVLRDLEAAAARFPEIEIVVKRHPELPPPATRLRVESEGRLPDLLEPGDALIAATSQSLYQAARRGFPVLVIHYGASPCELREPPGPVVTTRAGLLRGVNRLSVLKGSGSNKDIARPGTFQY